MNVRNASGIGTRVYDRVRVDAVKWQRRPYAQETCHADHHHAARSVAPCPYNPRIDLRPDDPRYRKLLRSVRTFGLVEPLIWNRRTGFVVGGHQRLKVLRDLGVTEAPVSVVDLPPDREKALNVILNNREAQSDFDVTKLQA